MTAPFRDKFLTQVLLTVCPCFRKKDDGGRRLDVAGSMKILFRSEHKDLRITNAIVATYIEYLTMVCFLVAALVQPHAVNPNEVPGRIAYLISFAIQFITEVATDASLVYLEIKQGLDPGAVLSTAPKYMWFYVALMAVPITNTITMQVPNAGLMPLCPMRLPQGDVAVVCAIATDLYTG